MKKLYFGLAFIASCATAQIVINISINGMSGVITSVNVNTNTVPIPPPPTNNTVFALSTSFVDVSNAVSQAQQGWTVQLPCGTNGWWQSLSIAGITLKGSGTNCTVIRDETPIVGGGNGTPFLFLNTTSSLTRVTGIQFQAGVTNNITNFANDYGCEIEVDGTNTGWRIDNCQFKLLAGKTIRQTGDNYGLVDHNNFLTLNRIAVEIFGNGYGDSDWANPITFGSSNSTYIENNYFHDFGGDGSGANGFGWVDVSSGGRVVFRYNQGETYYLNTHGTESSQRYRSARYVECYENTFSNTAYVLQGAFKNMYTSVDIRGGTAVIFSNICSGVNQTVLIRNYRSTDNNPAYIPFGGAVGLTNWDNNGAEITNGIATGGGSGGLTIAPGHAWITNAFVGCTVYNYQTIRCGIVTGNTASNMTFTTQGSFNFQLGFATNQTFSVHYISPVLDAPGVGTGDLLSGDVPTPVNLHQTTNTIYCWNNIKYRNLSVLTTDASNAVSQYPSIAEGRNFTNVVKVGYIPFTYPHPLDN